MHVEFIRCYSHFEFWAMKYKKKKLHIYTKLFTTVVDFSFHQTRVIYLLENICVKIEQITISGITKF